MRPKSHDTRSHAQHSDKCWQYDVTRYPLAGGGSAEIMALVDTRSRTVLSATAHARVTSPIVAAAFRAACTQHGVSAPALTDSSILFTAGQSGGGRGRSALDAELRRLGIARKNGDVRRPQDKAIAERILQALTQWLTAQTPQPADLTRL
jgi:transposase InsO family protein